MSYCRLSFCPIKFLLKSSRAHKFKIWLIDLLWKCGHYRDFSYIILQTSFWSRSLLLFLYIVVALHDMSHDYNCKCNMHVMCMSQERTCSRLCDPTSSQRGVQILPDPNQAVALWCYLALITIWTHRSNPVSDTPPSPPLSRSRTCLRASPNRRATAGQCPKLRGMRILDNWDSGIWIDLFSYVWNVGLRASNREESSVLMKMVWIWNHTCSFECSSPFRFHFRTAIHYLCQTRT